MKTCWDRFTTRDLRCASSSLAFARDHNSRWVRLSVLDRIPLLSQVVPVRKVRGKGPTAAKGRASAPGAASGKAGKTKEVAEAAAPDDLLPRTDISASITSNLADRFVRCANCNSICFFPRQYQSIDREIIAQSECLECPCSAKWQERNAALEEVEGVLKAAGGRIQPSVSNLVALLRVRRMI